MSFKSDSSLNASFCLTCAMKNLIEELDETLQDEYNQIKEGITETLDSVSMFYPNAKLALRLKNTLEDINSKAKQALSPIFIKIKNLLASAGNFFDLVSGMIESFQSGLNFDFENDSLEGFLDKLIGNMIKMAILCCISAGALTAGSIALGATLGAATFGLGFIAGSLLGDSAFKSGLNDCLKQLNKSIKKLKNFTDDVLEKLSKFNHTHSH